MPNATETKPKTKTDPKPKKPDPRGKGNTPEMTKFMAEFGKRIAKTMKKNNVTKEQLAEKLGTTGKYVTRMLNGSRAKMGVDEMQAIAKACGGEIDFDFSGGQGQQGGGGQQGQQSGGGETSEETESRLDDLEVIAQDSLSREDVVEICHDEVGPVLEDFSNRIEQLQKPNHFFVTSGKTTFKVEGKCHKDFKRVLNLASGKKRDGMRHNVLLIGPAGCGKTYLGGQIADVLKMDFGFISLSEGISESHLIGRYIPVGEHGRMEYVESLFVKMFKAGGVFLLDEMDAADPNVLVNINSAIANGLMRLPDGTEARRHEDFVLIAAANTYGHGADRMYCGRNQLDAATLDRFSVGKISMDYDEGLEASASNAELCKWIQALRKKARKATLRRVISTRFLFDASDAIQAGQMTLKQAKQTLLMDWNRKDLQAVGE